MTHLMKYTFMLATGILLTAFPSCKKSSTLTDCVPTKVQADNDTALITYDAQGRVLTYGNLSNGLFTFTYNGLTATATTQTNDINYHSDYTISLDAQGRATFITKSMTSGGAVFNYTFTFQYDADGHVIWCEQTLQQAGVSGITYYKDSMIYSNGNLTSKYTAIRSSATAYTPDQRVEVSYTSDLNKVGYHAFYYYEEPISMISGWNAFYHLLGTGSKNLPSVTKYYSWDNTQFYNFAYTFLLNENGYPSEKNIVRSINNPGSINRKFGYRCN